MLNDELLPLPHSFSQSLGRGEPLRESSLVVESRAGEVDRLLSFIDAAAHEMHLSLDRAVVRRCLTERLSQAEPPAKFEQRQEALLASTAQWRARVDLVSLSLAEAVELVRPRAPLGIVGRDVEGGFEWTLVADYRSRRLLVYHSSAPDEPRWLTIKELVAVLGEDAERKSHWLAFQPLLTCEPSQDAHGHRQTPWARLLALLAPERSDVGVIVVFAAVIGLLALSTPIAVEALVNTVAFGQFVQPVVVLALILFIFLSFAAAMRAVQTYVAEIIQRRLFVRVAADLAHRIPRVRSEFWTRHYGPELINRFMEVVTVQKVTALMLLDGTALLLQTLVGMAVIAFYHPILLGFDAFLLLFVMGIIFVLGRGAVPTSVEESRQKYQTIAWLEELARHRAAFRSTSSLDFAVDQTDRWVTGYLKARAAHFRILLRQIAASLALQVVASTILLGLGGWLVIRGELSLGQLVAAELIVTVIVGSFAKIGKYLEGYYDVMAAVDKLGHLFDMPVERLEGASLPVGDRGATVELHCVSTTPTINGETVRGASLQLSSGAQATVSGGSAALRSQLLQTLGGLQPPAVGHTLLDGHDMRWLRADSIRDQVAYIGRIEIFAGTVAENVHVGRPDATDEGVALALDRVGLLDELLQFPEGLDSVLETDGGMLSQDQQIRLMTARAMVGKPRLLLIDGLLDGLPDELLKKTLHALQTSLTDHCTLIVGAGRRDVIDAIDQTIIVDRQGRLRVEEKRGE